jgi:hypothetical protein
MVGKIQCCLVINFYAYPVDTNKDSKKNLNKKGYVFFKKNFFFYSSQLHIYFLKDFFASYVYAGFQFSKHGRYAQKICISNFQVYCLIKNLQQ